MNMNYAIFGFGLTVTIIIIAAYIYPWNKSGDTGDEILYDLTIIAEDVRFDSLQVHGNPLPEEKPVHDLSGDEIGTLGQLENGQLTKGQIYIRMRDFPDYRRPNKRSSLNVRKRHRPRLRTPEITLVVREAKSNNPFFDASVSNHVGETDDGVNVQKINLDKATLENDDFQNIDLPKEIRLVLSHDSNQTSVNLGRFTVEQPEWLKWDGGRFSVREVMINEMPWPDDTDPENAFMQRWESTINTLREREFKGVADIDDIIIDERNAEPGLRAVLYHRGYSPKERMWHALLKTDSAGVTFQKNSWKGDAEDDFKVVRTVANAYRENREKAYSDEKFYLRNGVITLPYKEKESVMARYKRRDTTLTYDFSTLQSKSSERDSSQSSQKGLLKKAAQADGPNTNSYRNLQRVVAGMRGREEIVRYSENGDEKVTFSWVYPGKKNTHNHPRIEIEMETSQSQFHEKLHLWDLILYSFQLHEK